MEHIPWEELKQKLIQMPKGEGNISLNKATVILNENDFVNSHIKVIDAMPKSDTLTNSQKMYRMRIAKPHYNRLLAYYYIRTIL